MRFLKIPVVGPIQEVDISDKSFLGDAYKLLDCSCIEVEHILQNRYIMIGDKSGKVKGPPKKVNVRASHLLDDFPHYVIVGDVLVGKYGITGDGPDIVGLEADDLKLLHAYFK